MACPPAETTRREAQREERRCAILKVARQAFHDQGYGGTTMSGIAATLGGSKGTLWAYFASKEELFAATMDALVEEFAPFFVLDPAKPFAAALIDYCTDFLTMMLTDAVLALNRLVIAEAPRFPELGRIFYERAPKRRQGVLATHLEERIRAGDMRPVDPHLASAQLHHLCQSRLFILSLWGVKGAISAAEIRQEAIATTELFLNGYGSETSRTR